MRNNKGFSLVELIVVIAIMTVLTGLISVSYRIVFGTNVKEFSNNLEAELNSVRVSTMGKVNQALYIYCDGSNGAYYTQVVDYTVTPTSLTTTTIGSPKKIGKKALAVTYKMSDGSTSSLTSGNGIYVFYDRSSGAFAKHPIDANYCSEISVSQGSHTTTLKLYKETGKVELQ